MKKGFTLIEVMLGLFLLGLITVSVLPITNGAFFNLQKQKNSYDMVYAAEMIIEKLKAYDGNSSSKSYIFDVEISQIIEEFRGNNYVEVNFDEEEYEYPIKLIKNDKSDLLWTIMVLVYNRDGGKSEFVELKAYITKK